MIAPAESVTRRPRTRLDRPGALDLDSNRTAVFDHYAVGVDTGPDREIHAMSCGREIADRGRYADTFAPVARPRSDAGGLADRYGPRLRRIRCAAGVEERAIERLPCFSARPFDPYRSADPVKIALRIAIIFELAMERQDLLEAPLAITPRRPFVEILRRAAQRYMSVDGRAAARHLAARVRNFASRSGLGHHPPIMRSGRDPGVQQVRRSLFDCWIVRTASSSRTLRSGSSLKRAASAAPEDPAPTIIRRIPSIDSLPPGPARRAVQVLAGKLRTFLYQRFVDCFGGFGRGLLAMRVGA